MATVRVTDSQGNVTTHDLPVTIEDGGGEVFDNVIENTTIAGDLTLTPGESTLIGPGVRVDGHVFVQGAGTVLAMRPGSHLTMTGGDPSLYKGGGLAYDNGPDAPYVDDIGIWVWNGGVLDIQGTPKVGWNRTGTDPTWGATDEYWIAPSAEGDVTPSPWSPGDPIPRTPIPAEGQARAAAMGLPQDWIDNGIPTEVINVTRDIIIEAEGAAHIHTHSMVPQTVKHVRIEGFGVSHPNFDDGNNFGIALGRYALHHHHGGDVAGEIWEGVALVNTKGRGMVPHKSDNITVQDCVAVNGYAEQFFWDRGDDTFGISVDRLCVSGVAMPQTIADNPRITGVALDEMSGLSMTNSVVSGVHGNGRLRVGFDWPEASDGVWDPFADCIAHNNDGPGLRFWTNNDRPHVVDRYLSYRNGMGVETGAYINAVRYNDCLILDRLLHQPNSKVVETAGDDDGGWYKRCTFIAPSGPAMSIGHLNASGEPAKQRLLIVEDCEFFPAAGFKKVDFTYDFPGDLQSNPWRAHFIRSGVTPDDFEWPDPVSSSNLNGTIIKIDDVSGPRWEIKVEGGSVVVTEL